MFADEHLAANTSISQPTVLDVLDVVKLDVLDVVQLDVLVVDSVVVLDVDSVVVVGVVVTHFMLHISSIPNVCSVPAMRILKVPLLESTSYGAL